MPSLAPSGSLSLATSPACGGGKNWRSSRRFRRFGDEREEGVFEARVAVDFGPARLRAVAAARLATQFLQRAFGDELAASDDADPVRHALGDFENVRGHDHGAAGAGAL